MEPEFFLKSRTTRQQ